MKATAIKGVSAVMLVIGAILWSACSKDEGTSKQLRTKEYSLSPVGNSGVTGKVVISENADSSFNVKVSLDKSVMDTVHVMHIHNGSISNPGSIAIPLTSITGTGGAASGETMNIKQATLPDNSVIAMTYDSILHFNGYVNVHYSAAKIDSLIAQTNIGSN